MRHPEPLEIVRIVIPRRVRQSTTSAIPRPRRSASASASSGRYHRSRERRCVRLAQRRFTREEDAGDDVGHARTREPSLRERPRAARVRGHDERVAMWRQVEARHWATWATASGSTFARGRARARVRVKVTRECVLCDAGWFSRATRARRRRARSRPRPRVNTRCSRWMCSGTPSALARAGERGWGRGGE